MTFTALLVKELRLRLRRERFVWVIITYLLVMSLLGFYFLDRESTFSSNQVFLLSQVGGLLYDLLAVVQLLLIVFIAPAFTSTAINGEKERQTFDLLLCSRLSSFSLLAGKLVAGLANALILIAASLPLFSLVFFFGGVAPDQVLHAVVVFAVTAITVGTFGLFCSTLVSRPAISTVIAYLFCVLWLLAPWVALLLGTGFNFLYGAGGAPQLLIAWNPLAALISTLPGGQILGSFSVRHRTFDYWIVFTVFSLGATIVFFLLSIWFVKPNPLGRLRQFFRRRQRQSKATATA